LSIGHPSCATVRFVDSEIFSYTANDQINNQTKDEANNHNASKLKAIPQTEGFEKESQFDYLLFP
jgi:hypothetical protein